MRKQFLLVVTMVILAVMSISAQETEPDPAIQQAKEETAVIYDLGRFFGYVHTMIEENPDLALTPKQLEEFHTVMTRIKGMSRVEADWADETLDYLELDLLTVKQLIAVDKLAIARESTRQTGTGESKGAGATTENPAGSVQTYVAGGAFNPMLDTSKSLGEGFDDFYKYVAKTIGK